MTAKTVTETRTPGTPQGMRTLTNFIIVREGARAMDWYMKVFDADEIQRLMTPDGSRLLHGDLRIGDSMLMLADEFPERGTLAPISGAPASSVLMLYVPDVDATYARAVAADATAIEAPVDQFWGSRQARLRDPFGHVWSVATHLRDVSSEEMRRAVARFIAESKAKAQMSAG